MSNLPSWLTPEGQLREERDSLNRALDSFREDNERLRREIQHWRDERQVALDGGDILKRELGEAHAEIERLKALSVHCERCGADYAQTGIEAECPCALRAEIERLTRQCERGLGAHHRLYEAVLRLPADGIERLTRELDEARAEIERLRIAANEAIRDASANAARSCEAMVYEAEQQRNEARQRAEKWKRLAVAYMRLRETDANSPLWAEMFEKFALALQDIPNEELKEAIK